MSNNEKTFLEKQILEELGPGLGNYVHLKQENYRKYGIIFKKDGAIDAEDLVPNHELQRQKLIKRSYISRKFKKESLDNLAKLFTSFIYSDWKSLATNGLQISNIEISEERIKKYLDIMSGLARESVEDMYRLTSGQDLENLTSLQKILVDGFKKYRGATKSKLFTKTNKESHVQIQTLKKIMGYLNRYQERINAAYKQQKITENVKKVLESEYDNLNKEINNLITQYSDMKSISKSMAINSVVYPDIKYVYDLIKKINDYVYGNQLYIARLGQSFESMADAFSTAYAKTVSEGINECMQAGQMRSSSVLKAGSGRNSMIDATILSDTIKYANKDNKNFSISANNDSLVFGASQNTVDWIVDPLAADGKNKNLLHDLGFKKGFTASLKNYKEAEKIHIISGTNVLALFSILDTKYVNHYLNIAATKSNDRNAKEMRKTIKLAILSRATLGNRGRYTIGDNRLNELLIINERSRQKVHVVQTKNIFEKLEHNLDLLDEYLITEGSIIPHLKNNKVTGQRYMILNIKQRITRMLADAHTRKLSASLSSKVFFEKI